MIPLAPRPPPLVKDLVVIADEFGISAQCNEVIVELFKKNAISCVSLLVNGKHSEAAAKLVVKHTIPSGLHFNIVDGNPVCINLSLVASLIDRNGRFFGERFWSKEFNVVHVENELKAQVQRYRDMVGKTPLRVDGYRHCHVHQDVFQKFAMVLQRLRIRRTRLPDEYKLSEPAAEEAAAVAAAVSDKRPGRTSSRYHGPKMLMFNIKLHEMSEKVRSTFKRYGLVYADVFIGQEFVGLAMDKDRLKMLLVEVYSKHTNCELMVHPGAPCQDKIDGLNGEPSVGEFWKDSGRAFEASELMSRDMKYFYYVSGIKLRGDFV